MADTLPPLGPDDGAEELGLPPDQLDDGPAISIRGLRNSFGEQVIHDDLDLDVRRGEILGVVGGSGTGKSVLMRSIIGLQQPDEPAKSSCSGSPRRPTSSIPMSCATCVGAGACCSRAARCSRR